MYDCSSIYLQLRADPASLTALRELKDQFTLPAILLQLPPGGNADVDLLSDLVAAGQALDAAAIIEDDIELARASKADGVHLSPDAEQLAHYEKARKTLNTDSIVGANVELSRHDAMTLGEAGADYIAFGPLSQTVPISTTGGDAQAELLAWWAEVFEIPCVGLSAGTPERARKLIDVGADFVGLNAGDTVDEAAMVNLISAFASQLAAKNNRTLVHG